MLIFNLNKILKIFTLRIDNNFSQKPRYKKKLISWQENFNVLILQKLFSYSIFFDIKRILHNLFLLYLV